MMRAHEVVYDPLSHVAMAAGPLTAGRLVVVGRDVLELDVVAGDDLSVRARDDQIVVETLNDRLLELRRDGETLRVLTEFRTEAEVEVGGLKEGEPVQPEFDGGT